MLLTFNLFKTIKFRAQINATKLAVYYVSHCVLSIILKTELDFRYAGGAFHMDLPDGPQKSGTDVSLISGKIRSMGVDEEEDGSSGALMKRGDAMVVANTAGESCTQEGILKMFDSFIFSLKELS